MSNQASSDLSFLRSTPFAHRGLHNNLQPIENSLPAFAAALEAGRGIECDVRLSRDGIVYIFHDSVLDRLTRTKGPLSGRAGRAIDQIALRGNNGKIPRLSALLQLLSLESPLLIEAKLDPRIRPDRLGTAILRDILALDSIKRRNVAVMSFDWRFVAWFAANAPDIPRGIVLSGENVKRRLAIQRSRANFIAHDIRCLPSPASHMARTQAMPLLSWTVRNAPQIRRARRYRAVPIFEGSCFG